MSWIGLPPGNILQQLYLRERIKRISKHKPPQKFLEIGCGNGHISNVLLNNGYRGVGVDLNASACNNNQQLNKKHIEKGNYKVIYGDFLTLPLNEQFDIILSCMVIEHLTEEQLNIFFKKVKHLLIDGGILILIVPANRKFWNIEDEIAGHIKRYEIDDVYKICQTYGFSLNKIVSLNYPVSNILFNVSNHLVRKHESKILAFSQKEKTIYTGNREVPYKTKFPPIFNLILNPVVLYPFHLIQKLFLKRYKDALVLYIELENKRL